MLQISKLYFSVHNPLLKYLRFWRAWISVLAPIILIAVPLAGNQQYEKVSKNTEYINKLTLIKLEGLFLTNQPRGGGARVHTFFSRCYIFFRL